MTRKLIKKVVVGGLNAAHAVGAYSLARRYLAGCGVIFSLHRVVEPDYPVLYPGHMIGGPALDSLIRQIVDSDWEMIAIGDVPDRLAAAAAKRSSPRFACFTLDDGYLDNLTVAAPIFRRYDVPYCVYVATSMIDRSNFCWWGANEALVLRSDRVELPASEFSLQLSMPAKTHAEKVSAFRRLDALCHHGGPAFYATLHKLYAAHGIDPVAVLDGLAMNPNQLRTLSEDPLATVGAHSVSHRRLTLLSDEEVRRELDQGRKILEDWIGKPVEHFAYPFGRADACVQREFDMTEAAAYKTAVTTRQGNLFPEHARHLMCLPRRSVPLTEFRARNVLNGVETLLYREPRFQTL